MSSIDAEIIHEVVCLKSTKKALLVEIDGDEHWIPKSVICASSEVETDGDVGELHVEQWFAHKEGLA